MTGDGGGHLLEGGFGGTAAIEAFEILAQRAQRGGGVAVPRMPGTAETRSASPPNSSISNPEALEVGRAREQRLAGGGAHLDQHRHEQTLRLEASGRQPLERPFVEHALVRDVLIDDCDALGIHRDDERVAELA